MYLIRQGAHIRFKVATSKSAAETQSISKLRWVVLLSFALSGFASLVYENAWTRSLTLVIGSSIYSFSTMLVTFLVGLALGGFIYARFLGGRQARLTTFGLIALWVGLSALATIPLFAKLPLIFLRLLQGFGDTFTVFLYLQVFVSALVMFIPTVLLGMTFPMVARLFTQSLYRVGSGVGSSYAANTVGAVLVRGACHERVRVLDEPAHEVGDPARGVGGVLTALEADDLELGIPTLRDRGGRHARGVASDDEEARRHVRRRRS